MSGNFYRIFFAYIKNVIIFASHQTTLLMETPIARVLARYILDFNSNDKNIFVVSSFKHFFGFIVNSIILSGKIDPKECLRFVNCYDVSFVVNKGNETYIIIPFSDNSYIKFKQIGYYENKNCYIFLLIDDYTNIKDSEFSNCVTV